MATLHINEFAKASEPGPLAVVPPLAVQSVTYTTSTASAALHAATRIVQLFANADAYLEFGANPTATASSMFLPANTLVELHYSLTDGNRKIAAYDGSS